MKKWQLQYTEERHEKLANAALDIVALCNHAPGGGAVVIKAIKEIALEGLNLALGGSEP